MKTGRRLLAAGGCAIALAVAISAPASAAPKPPAAGVVIALPPLPGGSGSGAWDINSSGVAVGWANAATSSYAVKWPTPFSVVNLGGLPGATGSGATAINNGGVVVGTSTVNGKRLPTKWTANGAPSELATPEGYANCIPNAVNDSGVAVGKCAIAGTDTDRPIRWQADGSAFVLPGGGGDQDAPAEDITNDGVVVGWERNWAALPFTLRWTADGTREVLYSTPSGALGVNGGGQISGWFKTSAVRWESAGGDPVQLPALAGAPDTSKTGFDINSSGVVVGDGQAADGRWVAIRWGANGSVAKLPTLPTAGPGTIDFATAVNDGGVIVGSSGGDAVLWNGFR